MKNKKHIDRVFQESFKDFETQPNPELWSKIQKDLQADTENLKPAFPFWMRIASVAAILAVLLTIGFVVLDSKDALDSPEIKTVNNPLPNNLNKTNNKNADKDKLNTKKSLKNNNNPNKETPLNVVVSENNSNKNSAEIGVSNSKTKNKANQATVANTTQNTAVKSGVSKTSTKNLKNKASATFASKTNSKQGTNTLKNRVATNTDNKYFKQKTTETAYNLNQTASQNKFNKRPIENAIALEAKPRINPLNEKEKEETLIVGDLRLSKSPSIEEAIAAAEDFTEKEEEEKLVNRWQVYANVAPVYYNSLGSGSHIDEQFVSNSKSGETNTSYGVNVSYALSKKLAIRSGVSALNLSYDTDNVILYEAPTGNTSNPINPLRNIELASGNETLTAFSAENLGVQQISNELYKAAISQRLSYYEVPVELEYKLLDKRFGINVIGGMSTFFLNDNEVYSEFEEYTTYIGEANNVNSVSFSTNLGIGMNYKFTEALKFNLEPTFKYQLNSFENTSGNFRPYIIGVYTGLSYRF